MSTKDRGNIYASMWKQAADQNKPTDNSTSVHYVLPSGSVKTELLIPKCQLKGASQNIYIQSI